jgi:hypothetical protein
MQRNLQTVVNKVNVVIVIVVVILIVLVTVVSSVRVIRRVNDVSAGVETQKIIAASSNVSNTLAIEGVVVNLNVGVVPVHVQLGVVLPVKSDIKRGRIHNLSDLGMVSIGNDIPQGAQIENNIAVTAIERRTIADISAGISSINTTDIELIAGINAAPIPDKYIGGGEAESIAQIDGRAAQDIEGGKIMLIAASRITGRSGESDWIG